MEKLDASVENLEELTRKFFKMHWNEPEVESPVPEWSGLQEVRQGSPLKYYDRPGVYAFVDKNGVVLYIGVGASRGGGLYKGHGIGARFHAYAKYVGGVYQIVDERFKGCMVITIGFEIEQGYMAHALESYLIGRLNTKYNSNRPGSASE